MPEGRVEVDSERCKGCGLCIEACPQEVLGFAGKFNSDGYEYVEMNDAPACIGCGFCGISCPDVALTVYKKYRTD